VLETDSLGVLKAFNSFEGVPWRMLARWYNCMQFGDSFRCSCSHFLREGNMVADALAKNGQGLSMHSSQWWTTPPTFILHLLYRDSIALSYSIIVMD